MSHTNHVSAQSQGDFLAEVKHLMQADSLCPDELISDGELHRCPVDKPNGKANQDGAYIVHVDQAPFVAWWLNWTTGESQTYCTKSNAAWTPKEKRLMAARGKENQVRQKVNREERQKEARQKAIYIWENTNPASEDHPYLIRKCVKNYNLKQTVDGRLIIPILHNLKATQVHSLQFISTEGAKRFLTGGKKEGGFFIIADSGKDRDPLIICEGYATGASIYEATGYSVIIAFDAGNLKAVAEQARKKYPYRKICFAADNDAQSDNDKNVGVEKANQAAKAIRGKLAVCPLIDGNKADFNDLANHSGLQAVKDAIDDGIAQATIYLPDNFVITEDGLFMVSEDEEEEEKTFIAPPLKILGKTRDKDHQSWGILISFVDPEGHKHTCAIPSKALQSTKKSEVAERLADLGYIMDIHKQSAFAVFLNGITTDKFITCVNSCGWHDGVYVLPDKNFGICKDEVVLQSFAHVGMFQQKGTMEEWKEIAKLTVGNHRLSFALCVAFSGSLLDKAGLDGAIINLEGGSSCGKTTSLQLAASVWGAPDHVRSWRATANSLEAIAALHNDNVLFLDEIGQIAAKDLQEMPYMLANGQGKSRLNRDSELKKAYSWKIHVLSTGEQGLASKLSEADLQSKAGQEVRFIGIPVAKSDITNLHGFSTANELVEKIKNSTKKCYGVAGREWIAKLVENQQILDDLENRIGVIAKHLTPADCDSQVLRVAKRFALIAYAGKLAEQYGVLPMVENYWYENDMDNYWFEAVQDCFNSWLMLRGGIDSLEEYAVLRNVRECIDQYDISRFEWINPKDELDKLKDKEELEESNSDSSNCEESYKTEENSKVFRRLGYKRKVKGKVQYLFFTETLESTTNQRAKVAARVLKKYGWLVTNADELQSLQVLIQIKNTRRRFYVVCLPDD